MSISQKKTAVRKKKEQLERRKSILAAAKEAFCLKGFMAATMEEIADSCSLAKGTLYLYFKSKEDLYVSIILEGTSLLRKELAKIANVSLPADKLLGELLRSYLNFYENNRKYFRIMFLSSQPDTGDRVPDELLKQCADQGIACMQVVSDVIEKGIESGIFRKVNPWTYAIVLWSAVNGIMMHYEQGGLYRDEILGPVPLHSMLQDALDLALYGLMTTQNRPE